MKKGFLKLTFVLAFLIMVLPIKVNALTFKVEKSADTVKPGGEVTVYVKASDVGVDSLQGYTINLTYDSSKLEYKSSSSDVSDINAASNPLIISKKASAGTISSNATLAAFVFGVKNNSKAGDCNLTIDSSNVVLISGNQVNATNTSSMVKVVSLSNDATLSSLKIPNTTLSPKFDKNTFEYTTTITDITELTVNAVTSDANAKIMISDNYKNLVKGENEIKIAVTAEDGSTVKNYIVKVTLKLTPTEEELVKANAKLKKLEIDGVKFDFNSDIKKYTITVPYKTKKINVLAEAENPNATIDMEGNTTLKVGRNTINVVVTSEDNENKETYVLSVTREKQEKKVVQTCPDETSSREWIMFSVSMILTFTLGIVLGYFVCKKEVLKKIFKKKNKKETPEEIDTLSDTIEVETLKKTKNNEKKKENNTEVKQSFNLSAIVGIWESVNLHPTVMIYQSKRKYFLSMLHLSDNGQAKPAVYEIQKEDSRYFIVSAFKRLYISYDAVKDSISLSYYGEYLRN